MIRENRYLVIKRSDIEKHLNESDKDNLDVICDLIKEGRERDNKTKLTCIVVESDWPEYDETWWKIAARMDGREGISPLRSRLEQIEKYGTNSNSSLPEPPDESNKPSSKDHSECRWFCGEGCPAEVY